jgi:hypothetical protein
LLARLLTAQIGFCGGATLRVSSIRILAGAWSPVEDAVHGGFGVSPAAWPGQEASAVASRSCLARERFVAADARRLSTETPSRARMRREAAPLAVGGQTPGSTPRSDRSHAI